MRILSSFAGLQACDHGDEAHTEDDSSGRMWLLELLN